MLVISSPDRYSMDMMKLPDNHIQSTYWHEFRLALQRESSVDSYLEMYRILVKTVADNQNRIDQFIRDNELNVKESDSPHKRGGKETVYMRLRNEAVGHRLSVSPECTRREIKLNIYNLKVLVKKAIEQL